jgi:hypothetical protein
MSDAAVHILGIRHHGPGSARSVVAALEALQPQAILIEGPPDADELIALAGHLEMQPPVALLIYRPDAPEHAVFYPFAVFSPEWQAIRWGLEKGVPVRFMDLPQRHRLALEMEEIEAKRVPVGIPLTEGLPEDVAGEGEEAGDADECNDEPVSAESAETDVKRWHRDPLGMIAEAAGYTDG